MPGVIGIIAGGGQFPRLIAEEARSGGMKVAVCGFYGHTDLEMENYADFFQLLHIGQLNKLLNFFQKCGTDKVCLAGAINKPRTLELRPDWRAARVIFSLATKGDDSLLRAVITELERQNLRVVSAADIVPSLRCPEGVLTKAAPGPQAWQDINFAWPIAVAMGSFDIGQCLVAKQGMVMAVECLEGTDVALERGAELGGRGCVAVKMVKPGQDERVDLPSVGLKTIEIMTRCGYSALALQAGTTLFFDLQKSILLAEKNNLSIVALPGDYYKEIEMA